MSRRPRSVPSFRQVPRTCRARSLLKGLRLRSNPHAPVTAAGRAQHAKSPLEPNWSPNVVTTQARLRFRPRPTGNRGPAPWSPLRVWPAVWQSQSSRGLTLGTRVESARDQGKNRRARVRSASGAGGGGEQAQVAGPGDGLGPAVGAKLGVQVADMGLDGIGRDIQLAGDFRPGQVGGQ